MSKKSPLQRVEHIQNAVVPIAALKPHPLNYNNHPEQQLKDLKASHHDLGQFQSIVVHLQPDGSYVIVSGHGFVEGARRDGATEIRADILAAETPASTIEAILLAANLHQRNSVPDEEILGHLLQEQQQLGVNLAALGADEEMLRQLLAHEETSTPLTSGENEDEEEDGEDLTPISDAVESSRSLPKLAFGKYRVPLTEEEYAALQFRVEAHITDTGSYYGFVRSLLHV